MLKMTNENKIWAEMARRKVRFYNNKNWSDINLWGLFAPSDIKPQIKRKELLAHNGIMPQNSHLGWFIPSKKAYNEFIKPLIDKYTLDELTAMAGWRI